MKRVLLVVSLVSSLACGSSGAAPGSSGGTAGGLGGTVGQGGSTGGTGSGGSGGSGGATGQSELLRALCEAQCARLMRCSPDKFPTATDCLAVCMAGGQPVDAFREDALLAVAACIRDLACNANDDLCIVRAAEQLDPNWIESADGKACLATHKTCNASGYSVGYADESCALFVIFSPSTLAAFNDCLAKPCPEVEDCTGAVMPF